MRFLKSATHIPDKSIKDVLDIQNHYEVLDEMFDTYENPLDTERIQALHQKLMKDPDQWGFYSHFSPGRFKIVENYTIRASGKIYEYMKPEHVPDAMQELVIHTNQQIAEATTNTVEKHPITIAAAFHNRFVYIHPFEDGNGRIARILTNQLLMKMKFPPLILLEETKQTYFEAIIEDHDNQRLEPTIAYFARTLLTQIQQTVHIE